MGSKQHTGSAKNVPTQEPDTALPVAIVIEVMIPVECLKCFSQPLFYANFCPQFNVASVNNPLFLHLAAPDK